MKKDSDDSEQLVAKRNSRESLAEKFGPSINLNLHDDSRERLVEIAQWINPSYYNELKKTKGLVLRQTISNLINMVYIDSIYEPKTKAAKTLKKLYERHFELSSNPEIDLTTLKSTLTKEYAKPMDIKKGKLVITEKGWTYKDLKLIQDYHWVIQTMEELDGISREQVKNTSTKK